MSKMEMECVYEGTFNLTSDYGTVHMKGSFWKHPERLGIEFKGNLIEESTLKEFSEWHRRVMEWKLIKPDGFYIPIVIATFPFNWREGQEANIQIEGMSTAPYFGGLAIY